jgi:hypothetical protein
LFLTDDANYQRHSSGIMTHTLAAGRPIIVPAGRWVPDAVASGAAVTLNGRARSDERRSLRHQKHQSLQAAAALRAL